MPVRLRPLEWAVLVVEESVEPFFGLIAPSGLFRSHRVRQRRHYLHAVSVAPCLKQQDPV